MLKKTALGALHKLNFDQNITANFGKQLGQLDQAIQSSEETSSVVNRKIFEEALKPKKEKKYVTIAREDVIQLFVH